MSNFVMDRTISALKRNPSISKHEKNIQMCSYMIGNRTNKTRNQRNEKRSKTCMYTGNNKHINLFQILLSLADINFIFANIAMLFYGAREMIYCTWVINFIIQPCQYYQYHFKSCKISHQSQFLNNQQSGCQSSSIPNMFNTSCQHDALIKRRLGDSLNDGSSWGQYVEIDLSKWCNSISMNKSLNIIHRETKRCEMCFKTIKVTLHCTWLQIYFNSI